LQRLLTAGLLVFLTGFALIIVGSATQGDVSTGGAIFIGPFPIAFGSGPNGWSLALASVVIGGVMLALVILWSWLIVRKRNVETATTDPNRATAKESVL
jgi:uncharacterized membrane protein